jgi:glycosyltransferase involved in cell wall biosynthesis
MLSILIPVYNYYVERLVKSLLEQAILLGQSFEIILFDDCSEEVYKSENQKLAQLPNIRYKELPGNAGRAKIRNMLADAASYNYLLFLDCDQQIESKNFLLNYYKAIAPGIVVCGGRSYSLQAPADATYLRWLYGMQRETTPATKRNIHPYNSFLSCNFLIDKETFQSIRFNETLVKYGHEDTLFGIELKKHKVPVKHIQNPILHEGLEDAETFLEKSRIALQNLHFLYQQTGSGLAENVKILKWFEKLKRFKITALVSMVFSISKKELEKNLKSQKPSLKQFDFYRLGYFIQLSEWNPKLLKSSSLHSPN